MKTLTIYALGAALPAPKKQLAAFLRRAFSALGVTEYNMSVVFCGDEHIRQLNAQFRNIDEPTDILSFAAHEGGGGEPIVDKAEGDLVISLDTMAKNAHYFGVAEEEELRRLLLHGVLHLLGYDHRTNDAGEAQLVLQEKLLKELPWMMD